MSMSFNYWFVVAPIGALVAVWLGYRLQNHRYAKFIQQSFAVVAAVVILILFFVESYAGAVQFCLDRNESAMADFVAIFALVATAVAYGALCAYLGEFGEYLNYSRDERKALRKARRKNPAIEYVITSRDLRQILEFVRCADQGVDTGTKLFSLPR